MVVGRGNDAIPTWSGFNYQGKMMLLYVLELINQILCFTRTFQITIKT